MRVSRGRKTPHYLHGIREEERRRKAAEWFRLLENDLGVKVIKELPDAHETGSEGTAGTSDTELQWAEGSEPETISSHEFGVEVASASDDETEAGSEKEDEELVVDHLGKPCFFHKAMRQKVRRAAQEIGTLGSTSQAFSTTTRPARLPEPELPQKRRFRRPGPRRMIEIFTWTMLIGMAACARGWDVGEPITAPGYDLLTPGDQALAKDYLRRFDPDFVMIAWPSALWMPVSMSGAVKVGELEDLGQERAKVRSMLAWLQDVVLELRRQGIVIVAEHPARKSCLEGASLDGRV